MDKHISEGDEHLRLVKSVLSSTFPNISGAVSDPIAWLNERTAALEAKAPATTQLDRIERLLEALLAKSQTACLPPLAACTAHMTAAQTVSARGFFLHPSDVAAESQKTFPAPRCSGSTGTDPEASQS